MNNCVLHETEFVHTIPNPFHFLLQEENKNSDFKQQTMAPMGTSHLGNGQKELHIIGIVQN